VASINVKRIVNIVVDARKAKESDATIVDRLAAAGIAVEDAPTVIDVVENGFKQGTLAVVTGGLSSAQIPFGQDPLFDAAFRSGRAAMRWTSPGWVLMRMALPVIVALALIIAIVYAIVT